MPSDDITPSWYGATFTPSWARVQFTPEVASFTQLGVQPHVFPWVLRVADKQCVALLKIVQRLRREAKNVPGYDESYLKEVEQLCDVVYGQFNQLITHMEASNS